jgi:hypothetical protein
MAYMTQPPDKGGYLVRWRLAPFDADFVALRIGEDDPPARLHGPAIVDDTRTESEQPIDFRPPWLRSLGTMSR